MPRGKKLAAELRRTEVTFTTDRHWLTGRGGTLSRLGLLQEAILREPIKSLASRNISLFQEQNNVLFEL